jgi:hypothetical protein
MNATLKTLVAGTFALSLLGSTAAIANDQGAASSTSSSYSQNNSGASSDSMSNSTTSQRATGETMTSGETGSDATGMNTSGAETSGAGTGTGSSSTSAATTGSQSNNLTLTNVDELPNNGKVTVKGVVDDVDEKDQTFDLEDDSGSVKIEATSSLLVKEGDTVTVTGTVDKGLIGAKKITGATVTINESASVDGDDNE